jgi:hypothetical protein
MLLFVVVAAAFLWMHHDARRMSRDAAAAEPRTLSYAAQ